MCLKDLQAIPVSRPSLSGHVLKFVGLAFVVAAGVATLVTVISNLSESRFHRKMINCADSIQSAMPTLRHAAELYIAEHAPEMPDEADDMPF